MDANESESSDDFILRKGYGLYPAEAVIDHGLSD